jgi:hypothetical protein
MDYLIKALATWRLVKLLMEEDGPYDCLRWFRHQAGVRYEGAISYGTNELSEALTCKYCLSVWVGLALVFVPVKAAMPFALSAAALLVDKHYGKS